MSCKEVDWVLYSRFFFDELIKNAVESIKSNDFFGIFAWYSDDNKNNNEFFIFT